MLQKMKLKGKIRKVSKKYYKTDNENYIFDIFLEKKHKNLRLLHKNLINLPFVIETGLFFDLKPTIIIGYKQSKKIEIF